MVRFCLPASQRKQTWGAQIEAILGPVFETVDPGRALARVVRRDRNWLVGDRWSLDLDPIQRLCVVGGGKASAGMARALEELLGDRIDTGLLALKFWPKEPPPAAARIQLEVSGHPVPDARSESLGNRMVQRLRILEARDAVLCPISGGFSSLVCCPPPPLTLSDLQLVTARLLEAGASIFQLNTVRKHLDLTKGGNLARLAHPASLVGFILSDVPGDSLDAVGSGPTLPDSTTCAEALEVLARYDLLQELPDRVRTYLQSSTPPPVRKTPGPGPAGFEKVWNVHVASNREAVARAVAEATAAGLKVHTLPEPLTGPAHQAGYRLAHLIRAARRHGTRPGCLVAGGETTVCVTGRGRGGRNQELVLAAAIELHEVPDLAFCSLATDGEDGPTDAAGAIATGQTLHQAQALGLDAADHLRRNDSYTFFDRLGDLIRTGPTGTNVCDLVVAVWG